MKYKVFGLALTCAGLLAGLVHAGEIATAVQKGAYVYGYDKDGRQVVALGAGSSAQSTDGLVGYTSSTISIRKGAYIYTYDEKGRQLSAIGAK